MNYHSKLELDSVILEMIYNCDIPTKLTHLWSKDRHDRQK
jgi:hypothetical protein